MHILYSSVCYEEKAHQYFSLDCQRDYFLGPLNPQHRFRPTDIVIIFGDLEDPNVLECFALYHPEAATVLITLDGVEFYSPEIESKTRTESRVKQCI